MIAFLDGLSNVVNNVSITLYLRSKQFMPNIQCALDKLTNIINKMKIFLSAIFAFACVAELCVASKIDEYFRYQDKEGEVPNEFLEDFKKSVLRIKGIRLQATDDVIHVATELKQDYPAYRLFTNYALRLLWRDMAAENNVLNATLLEEYFKIYTGTTDDEEWEKMRVEAQEYNELCTEFETILAQKLQPEQFNRVKTFMRTYLGTREQILAGLTYLYIGDDSKKTVVQ